MALTAAGRREIATFDGRFGSRCASSWLRRQKADVAGMITLRFARRVSAKLELQFWRAQMKKSKCLGKAYEA